MYVEADPVSRGKTPLELALPRGESPVTVSFKLAGHEPRERKVDASRDHQGAGAIAAHNQAACGHANVGTKETEPKDIGSA